LNLLHTIAHYFLKSPQITTGIFTSSSIVIIFILNCEHNLCKMCSSKSNPKLTYTVKPPSKHQHICTKDLTSKDLADLKETDSFMYYSIPSVRKAAILGKDEAQALSLENEGSVPQIVTRQSRISFEFHSDILIEDLLLQGTENLEASSGSDGEEEDFFDLYLAMLEKQVIDGFTKAQQ
jgi:hypothetical protein